MRMISALSGLKPNTIVDVVTGEVISENDHDKIVLKLLNYVSVQARTKFEESKTELIEDISKAERLGSANSFGRQRGYSIDYMNLPKHIKARSRINELYLHKLITETASWVNNPNPHKREPTFAPKINLGAIDKQMAVLGYDAITNELELLWKVWDRGLLLTFQLPSYILQRNIKKISLPTVQLSKKTGQVIYIFSIEEIPAQRKKSKLKAGVDLGRAEPFTLAILTEDNRRIAHYSANGRVKQLNKQRENILIEKKHTLTKANSYDALGLGSAVLRINAQNLANKAKILGNQVSQQLAADLTKKLIKHEVSVLNIENLSWVHGNKYGSKWNHSQQQEAITHALKRQGITTKKVNPKSTSQSCHLCGSTVTHNSRTRVAKCTDCKQSFDRDFNAAINIARDINKNKNRFPDQHSKLRDNPSSAHAEQVIDHNDQNSIISNQQLLLL